MMDKITLSGLKFWGYHGFLPEEKVLGQHFIIDLVMEADLQPAGKQDDLSLTINYGAVYEVIKAVVEEERYDLIEALAERIAQKVLAGFAVITVTVTVNKPHAPIPGNFDNVAVEIRRGR